MIWSSLKGGIVAQSGEVYKLRRVGDSSRLTAVEFRDLRANRCPCAFHKLAPHMQVLPSAYPRISTCPQNGASWDSCLSHTGLATLEPSGNIDS